MHPSRTATIVLLIPLTAVLLVTIAIPGGLFFVYSFFTEGDQYQVVTHFSLSNYTTIFTNPLYRDLIRITLSIAIPTTVLTVTSGYAVAYFIAFRAERLQNVLLGLVAGSLLASFIVRVYAWRSILGEHGVINSSLQELGLTHGSVNLYLFTRVAVVLSETNSLLPLVILIIYASLSGIPADLRESSRDLGAGAHETFLKIILPMSSWALFSAIIVIFFLSVGDYITPEFLGGATSETIGIAISDALRVEGNYPLGASLACVMLAGLGVAYLIVRLTMRATSILPRGGSVKS